MQGCRWLAWMAWLACACAFAGVPERPRFRIVGPAQGLPSTEIRALARDADGYLWIATADGLARHDGVDMRVWRHDPQTPDGLPGNNVQALLLDSRDRAWVATEGGGISVLDRRRQHFTHYRAATHPGLGSDDVWALARQGDAVWAGTYEGGLTRIDAGGGMRRYTWPATDCPRTPCSRWPWMATACCGSVPTRAWRGNAATVSKPWSCRARRTRRWCIRFPCGRTDCGWARRWGSGDTDEAAGRSLRGRRCSIVPMR